MGASGASYAEDAIRAVEREVRHIEAMIRQQYPGAEYIELEPMSKFADRFAIDDSFEEKLLQIEKEELQRWVRVLYETKQDAKTSSSSSTKSSSLESKSESSNNNSKDKRGTGSDRHYHDCREKDEGEEEDQEKEE